jgi:hypothetical protein
MTDAPVSVLRRRMIEDMTSRRLAPKTQGACIRAVKNFTAFFGRSPDLLRSRQTPLWLPTASKTGFGWPVKVKSGSWRPIRCVQDSKSGAAELPQPAGRAGLSDSIK